MSVGEIKRYRIKDKSGNTKDVIYDPSCGLSAQEFLSVEIAKFNAEKEATSTPASTPTRDAVSGDDVSKTQENDLKQEEPAPVKKSAPKKKERSLASWLASKSGVKLSDIVTRRNTESRKGTKKPKGISMGSYITKDRLVANNIKK